MTQQQSKYTVEIVQASKLSAVIELREKEGLEFVSITMDTLFSIRQNEPIYHVCFRRKTQLVQTAVFPSKTI